MDDHPELPKLRDQHLALQDRLHKACVKICHAKNEYAGIDQQLQALDLEIESYERAHGVPSAYLKALAGVH